MIKKLRIRLIAVSMLSLLTVLLVIMSAINILNYRSIVQEADSTLSLLESGGGKFPMRSGRPNGSMAPIGGGTSLSPELPYVSRFFSVSLSDELEVLSVETEHIAAVDKDAAANLALTAARRGRTAGFVGHYRYRIREISGGQQIIFLDCTRDLETFRTFLFSSCGISLAGLAAVFVLILLLSHRIIRPVSESYEKQKRFITDAGHEIKTPITIIDADAEVLEMSVPDNEWLQDIRKQVKRLGALTHDLIYLSRMEEDQLNLQTIDFPLSDLVAETAQSFQTLAKTQDKSFFLDITPMLTLHGDERTIRQLISVLLDNAVKYTPAGGGISLTLQKQNKTVLLTVTNTSERLLSEEVPHLFDRFYRADASRSSEMGGYGIGLSIAKAVVTAHKGKINATAFENDGIPYLAFTVSLPIG